MFRPWIARSFARRRPLTPRLDRLEVRQLLAAKPALVTVSEVSSGTSYGLIIKGTARNDSIFIVDNGKGTAGSVVVAAGGGVAYTSQHPLGFIQVLTGPGKDRLSYTLQGDLQANVRESLFASSGGSSLTGLGKSVPGGGSLQMTANIGGRILPDSQLSIIAQPDPKGATSLLTTDASEIDGGFSAGVTALVSTGTPKKLGPVNFTFSSISTIGKNGIVGIGALGGSSRNSMTLTYLGTNNGNINLIATGSGAKDVVSADLDMSATSTGTVGLGSPSLVGSSGKGAKVRFAIYRGADSTTKTGINAEINAAPSNGVVMRTRNVLNMTPASETILP